MISFRQKLIQNITHTFKESEYKIEVTQKLIIMIITTTNTIENATIEKYLGVVTTNLVIGAGFFSDFTAQLTDFFGGCMQ